MKPTVHLATGVATTLDALAREAIALCDSRSTVTTLPERPFDVGGFCGDPARAAAVLGWKAAIPLRAGMEELREEMRYRERPIADVPMPRARAAISVEVRQ